MKKNNTITSFNDRRTLRELEAEMIQLLKPMEKKYGIKISGGGGRFSSTDYTTKVTMRLPVTSEAVKQEGETMSRALGFEENIVGKSFVHKGRAFTIDSFNLRSKYSVGCGGTRFTPDAVKRLLAEQKGAQHA